MDNKQSAGSSKRWLNSLLFTVTTLTGGCAMACGPTDTLGTVCTFAQNWCPQDMVPADGRLLQISHYEALYTLYGTTFGGDGNSTFGVPDLRGRAVVGVGQGTGLSAATRGQTAGTETLQLTAANLPPSATFTTIVQAVNANSLTPSQDGFLAIAQLSGTALPMYQPAGSAATVAAPALSATLNAGSPGTPVARRGPQLAVNQCIVVNGIYPRQN